MMKKWSLRVLAFIALLIVMNFAVAWVVRLTAPNFTDTLAGWFNSSGVEDTADLLIDFTFLSALLLTVIIMGLLRLRRSR
jgi:hypothetical protein